MNVGLSNAYLALSKNNQMFGDGDSLCSFDLFRPFKILKNITEKDGIRINTPDIALGSGALDALIQCDVPFPGNQDFQASLKVLILIEPSMIRPDNWNWRQQLGYDHVCTWDIDWIENCGFEFITPFTCDPEEISRLDLTEENFYNRKLIVAVSGNKRSNTPGELYSLRFKDYEWLLKNTPSSFELAGVGWDTSKFNRLISPTNNKRAFISSGRFAIAYENTQVSPGYISEKIFDCFKAGTVPVYMGDPRSMLLIPKECYVDRRTYISTGEMFDDLANMSFERWCSYLRAFEDFIRSPSAAKFSSVSFARSLTRILRA
jgi:alpha(1,3/1,4) fucosyltransferase